MKRGLCLPLLLLVLVSHAFGQVPGSPLPRLSPAQLAEDFRIARSALEEGHSGIYRYTSKSELDHEFDDAAKKLDHPMDCYEFYRLLATTIAAVKCGHTSVSLPKPIQDELSTTFPILPLYMKVIDGKAYVLRDMSLTGGKLTGLELLSVNGVRASKIVDTLIDATPADGDVETSREYRISGWRLAMGLARMFQMTSPYHVALRAEGSRLEYRAKLEGETLPHLTAMLAARYPQDAEVEHNGDLEFLDGGAVARMTIRGFYGFADDGNKVDMATFINASFDAIRARGSTALVLDLRNNGGGEDELGKLLLSYLVDRPFDYYDDLVINKLTFDFSRYTAEKPDIPESAVERRADGHFHMIGHPNWGTQKPSTPGFSGKVVILINGGSFSTTSEFLSQVDFRHRATFVGEESGGAFYGNTSGFVPTVVLPNSKLQVRVPLMTYYLAVKGPHDAARGTIPDYEVQPTIDDLVEGKDRAMQTALDLARGRKVRAAH